MEDKENCPPSAAALKGLGPGPSIGLAGVSAEKGRRPARKPLRDITPPPKSKATEALAESLQAVKIPKALRASQMR